MSVKKCNKCGVVKALTEFNKMTRSKDGHRYECRECQRLVRVRYYSNNREHALSESKRWSRENPERKYQHGINKRKKNPAIYTAIAAKRRAAKLQRTVAWADLDAIKAIYAEAQRLQDILGIEFHIDHIVPLQGELVSGLHVETNLQIIPAPLNLRKSNKFEV